MSENPADTPLDQDSTPDFPESEPRASEAEELDRLREQVQRLEAENAAQTDLALRAAADLENYRRRVRRDQEQAARFAALPLIEEVLPVLDNLQRALAAVQGAESSDGLLQGVQMVAAQLAAALARQGVEPISALGAPFDPALHEAVGQQPSEEHPAGCVMQVLREGYLLHDRTIRAAQVFVSTGPPAGEEAGAG